MLGLQGPMLLGARANFVGWQSKSACYTHCTSLLTCLADAAAASSCAASMGACMLFSSLVLGPAEALLPGLPELVAVLPLLVLLVAVPDVLGASAEAGLGALRPCALLVLVELGPRPGTGLLLLLLAPLFAPSLHVHESRKSYTHCCHRRRIQICFSALMGMAIKRLLACR